MQKWMIPCNVKNFDVVEHFRTNTTAFFKRNRALSLGDEVYIYVASPYSEIKYKGVIIQTGIKSSEVDKAYKVSRIEEKTFVLVEITKTFPEKTFPSSLLKENGLGQVVNQQPLTGKIEKFIIDIENSLENGGE